MRRLARLTATARRLPRDRHGSVSVEFAILAWPLIGMILMGFQGAIYQYTQLMLSNTLFDTAASPPLSVLAGDQAGYRDAVCGKLPFMTTKTCQGSLLVELSSLSSLSTTPKAVTGSPFHPGLPTNVMVLRASVPVLRVFPALPQISAQASVVFRRP